MSIELALCPDGRWDFDAAEVGKAAAAAGFAAIGLPLAHANAESKAVLADLGVRCFDVMAQMVSLNEKTLEFARKNAVAAAAAGAECILTVSQLEPNAEAIDMFGRTATILAESGVRMAIEFAPFAAISSIDKAASIVEAIGTDKAGVLIDTWHFFRGDSTWEQLENIPLEQIAYVQFDDAPEVESPDLYREATERRVFPGDGTFDLDRFTATLLGRGWNGTASIEVLSAELGMWPVSDFATAAYKKTSPYWAAPAVG